MKNKENVTHPQKEKRTETESRKKPDVRISRQGILKATIKTILKDVKENIPTMMKQLEISAEK